MERLGQHLQITWTTPFEMDSEFQTADGVIDLDRVRIVYSSEGPPFLEMIEVGAARGLDLLGALPAEASITSASTPSAGAMRRSAWRRAE